MGEHPAKQMQYAIDFLEKRLSEATPEEREIYSSMLEKYRNEQKLFQERWTSNRVRIPNTF